MASLIKKYRFYGKLKFFENFFNYLHTDYLICHFSFVSGKCSDAIDVLNAL